MLYPLSYGGKARILAYYASLIKQESMPSCSCPAFRVFPVPSLFLVS